VDNYNLGQMLIDNHFKEGNLYWIRNSAFMVAQTVLLGFTINVLLDPGVVGRCSTKFLIILFEVVGIAIAFLHICVLKKSKEYQQIWTNTFCCFARQPERKNDKNLKVLACAMNSYPDQKKTTFLAFCVACIFLGLWGVTFIFTVGAFPP